MDSLEAFRRRTAAAPDDAQAMGMYFDVVLGLLARATGPEAAQALEAERRLPRRRMALLRYPVRDLLGLIEAVALRLEPPERFPDALVQVGRGIAEAYLSSPMGAVLIKLGGSEPHRVMAPVPVAYLTTFTFGTRRYERRAERAGAMHFQGDWLGPSIGQGIFEAGNRITSNVEALVRPTAEARDGLDFVLEMSW